MGKMAEQAKTLSHRNSLEDRKPLITRSSHLRLEEYALSLVSALMQEAQTGGRVAFDRLFDFGFNRVYALAFRIEHYDFKRAEKLTSAVFSRSRERLISSNSEQLGTGGRLPRLPLRREDPSPDRGGPSTGHRRRALVE
jgi:hypothetical protein